MADKTPATAAVSTDKSAADKPNKVASALAAIKDPTVRQQMKDQLASEIADEEAKAEASQKAHEEKLASLRSAQSFLDGGANTAAPVVKRPAQRAAASSKPAPRAAVAPGSGAKRGRPAGPPANHKPAILAALKGQRNGLSRSELLAVLATANHGIQASTLSTLLSKMSKDSQVLVEGEARSYRYKLPAKR